MPGNPAPDPLPAGKFQEAISIAIHPVRGPKLYYEEAGSGHPMVFVHEFGSDLREWETQMRWFSRYYRCIAFNARGYTPSDVPSDPALYGYKHEVNDIAAVMNGLGPPPERKSGSLP